MTYVPLLLTANLSYDSHNFSYFLHVLYERHIYHPSQRGMFVNAHVILFQKKWVRCLN